MFHETMSGVLLTVLKFHPFFLNLPRTISRVDNIKIERSVIIFLSYLFYLHVFALFFLFSSLGVIFKPLGVVKSRSVAHLVQETNFLLTPFS